MTGSYCAQDKDDGKKGTECR